MDKNAIKKYAVWARTELITRVSQRAEKYDITAEADASASSVNGVLLFDAEIKQRKALIEQVKQKGFDQVMEEVAYTWFNRFIALRFMEVNGYLPSHIRVFTDDNNNFKPQILAEAIHLELDGLDMEKVYEMKNNNENDELYKYLIITQCNELSKILPGMFQKIADYTELLFPDNILREGSVIEQMITQISEKDWDVNEGGQVEILGWLYQFYISEKHDEIIDIEGKKAISKEELPAATALFTTDWVVRYIVDNTIGRYWIERNPGSKLIDQLEFFVSPKSGQIPVIEEKITPEELTVFDPSMGSAHFGVYAFDVLMKIYMEYGVSERDAATSIVQKNLYGLDIDDRSAQIAYFAIMMKARQYDRRFFSRGIQPHFYSIQESNGIDRGTVEYFADGNDELRRDIDSILHDFHDAKEYGSIIQVNKVDFEALFSRLAEIEEDININRDVALKQIKPLLVVAKIMSDKYAVVATNPPYLNKYDAKLKEYLANKYKDYSGDLFSVFIYRNFSYCKPLGYSGFMTPFVWMFIKLYQKLREYIVNNKSIVTLVQMEYSAFEEATVPICSFVLQNGRNYSEGYYIKLSDFKGGMDVQKEKVLDALHDNECSYFYETHLDNFLNIPASPISYWANDKVLDSFKTFKPLGEYAEIVSGMTTGNNDKYMRTWFEVSLDNIAFNKASLDEVDLSKTYWFPYNKGGAFRRWYGNNDYVVNWSKSNEFNRAKTTMTYLYLKPCITWSDITSAIFSARACGQGFFFDVKGSCAFPDERTYYPLIAFLNSKMAMMYIKMLNPTISTQVGDLKRIPFNPEAYNQRLVDLSKECIRIGKEDYDSFEESWDFKKHPLIRNSVKKISDAYELWSRECKERFQKMKNAEREMNQFFIDLYDMGKYMTPDNDDKYVSVHLPDVRREVTSLISFAVGCMFGRYSLDEEGLIFAGGNWNNDRYKSFAADKDGILPICDDEYFEDDITARFISFLQTVYGTEYLEDNLNFVAEALGGTGSARDVIRNYFINDFYADHIKTYQKRPIYWLFDSGKKNGFKCLIYMHRYQPDTIARIRTDYVHEQQARYRTAIEETEKRLLSATGSEKVKLDKKIKKLREQDSDIHGYEEKIHHLADQMIPIDLDDGVKVNYAKLQDVLAKVR